MIRLNNQEKIWAKMHERPGCRCKFCRASRSAKAAATLLREMNLKPPSDRKKKLYWVSSGKRGSFNAAVHQVEKRPKERSRRNARKQHPRNQWL